MEEEHGPDAFTQRIVERQQNLLPHDFIAHDHEVNDVLWHNSTKAPRVQRIGAAVIGSCLMLCALAVASISYEKGAWLATIPVAAIGGFGGRILYKSFFPSSEPRH